MSNLSKQGLLAKAVTALTSTATVLSLSGVAYLAPVAALAATPADFGLKEGDVVSAAGSDDPDVYIVNEQGYKRLFLNPAIFNFYGHLGGFAAVKNVSPATRDAFGTSGLFRNCETNDPKVYGVETTGEDVGMLHWVNTSGAQAVADDPNFFAKVFCINNNEFNWYPKGSDYTSVTQVPNYSRSGGPVVAGNVSVSLASSNPVASTLVIGQSRAHLASFMFSGSGSVTNLKLKRTGVSADATLTNVYLYEGARRLTDSATVADGHITFNDTAGIFTAGKVISVLADVGGTAGETVGVQVVAVNGNAAGPVSGNTHTLATATLATVALASSTTPSANSSLNPANDALAWQNTVTVGNRYVWLKSVQFRVIGSVLAGDLRNYRLFVDGVQAGSAVAAADANGYVVFDVSGAPVKLETGGRVLKVLVDVVGGSNRNFTVSLRQASDIWTTDSQYNAGVSATAAGSFPVDAGQQTISQGTLTITKTTDSPSGDVVKDSSGVVLGRFEFKAQGERMKVENLRATFTHSDGGNVTELRNGALFANGVQIGSTADIEEDSQGTPYTQYNLGSSLIVEPGTPVIVEVRADVFDGDGSNEMAANNTFNVELSTGSSNAQRLTSLNYVNAPASDVVANTLTVKTGSLTGGKYTGYANQSVVTPKTGVKLGHFTLAAASSEDVNVNTIDIGFNDVTGNPASKTLDVYIKVWNDAGAVVYTSPTKATVTDTSSSSYSVNFTLPKSKTYQVEVWGNFDTIAMTGRVLQLEFSATGTTTGSSTSSTSTVVVGQTITTTTGSLTVANGSLPVAQFRQGGSTATAYQFTVTPAYDDYYLDEVYVDLSSTLASSTGAVANLMLKDGSTTLATAVVSGTTGSASFTGLNLSLPQASGTKTLTVDVQLANVGVGNNDTAGDVTVRLDGLKYRTSGGSITTENGYVPATYGGNSNVVVKGFPTFTNALLPTIVLNSGENVLFKTVVSATGSQVAWNSVRFNVASSSAATTITSFKLFENGVDITSQATGAAASSSDVGSSTNVEFAFATERVVSSGGSVTLELKGTVGGTLVAGDSVSTKIANPQSTVSSDDSTTQAAKNATFIWTDQSAAAHSTSTDDWFTDALVKTLDATQSLAK